MSNETQTDLKSIRVSGELSPDPAVCKFNTDVELVRDWTLIFRSPDESLSSPLVDELFAIDGVGRIKVSGRAVTVTKTASTSWPDMAREIVPALRRVIAGGPPFISEQALASVEEISDEDLAGVVEQTIESHINPAIAMHGGYVKLVKIEDRDVYLEMGGGCKGCAASRQTLKDGIETAIRNVAPQVRNILDVTDHAAGTNPYYR